MNKLINRRFITLHDAFGIVQSQVDIHVREIAWSKTHIPRISIGHTIVTLYKKYDE